MSFALFLKVDGADGESKESAHKDWIDVDSFSWGIDQPAQAHTGGGLGAGKVSVHDLTVTANVDKAFTTLSGFCASGKHIAKAQFAASKAGGDSPVEYYKTTLEDVIVTSVQLVGSSGAEMKVNYAFNAAKLKNEYFTQTEKGSKGPGSDFGWNVKENKKL